jgi:hypothetical protein
VNNSIDVASADVVRSDDPTQPAAAAVKKRPSWAQTEGTPLPLGVTWIEQERAFNFAVHSEHAESVTLLLYSSDDLVTPPPDIPFRFSTQQIRPDLAL